MQKIKIFLLLALRGALPTFEFLITRKLEITNKCYFYNHNSENINHIFKNCLSIQGIWDRIEYNYHTSHFYESNILDLIEMIYKNYKTNCKFFKHPMKKIATSYGMYGLIEIRFCLKKFNQIPFSLLRKLSCFSKIFNLLWTTLICIMKDIMSLVWLRNGFVESFRLIEYLS